MSRQTDLGENFVEITTPFSRFLWAIICFVIAGVIEIVVDATKRFAYRVYRLRDWYADMIGVGAVTFLIIISPAIICRIAYDLWDRKSIQDNLEMIAWIIPLCVMIVMIVICVMIVIVRDTISPPDTSRGYRGMLAWSNEINPQPLSLATECLRGEDQTQGGLPKNSTVRLLHVQNFSKNRPRAFFPFPFEKTP